MSEAFKLAIDSKGIARLNFDLPGEKINKLSLPVLKELDTILDEVKRNTKIQALVLTSAKDGIFIAGADLKSFEGLFQDFTLAKEMVSIGHAVLNKLQDLPFPTVAVINGACLGGGLELALACTFRIVGDHSKTVLGLPETTLGIFPGWGGTQRLPRLVGLTEGLTMILTGQTVNAKKAYKIHLADAIFPSEFLNDNVEGFLKKITSEKERKQIIKNRQHKGLYALLFEKNPLGRAIVYWKTKKTILQKTKGRYPAPLAALEVIKSTYTLPLRKGLEKEIEYFVKGMPKDFRYAPNLIYIFFNSEAMKKDPGFSSSSIKGHPVNSAGVLGAGVMGSGIAWLLSYRDIPVRMKDVNWDALGRGLKSAWDTYKTLIKKKKVFPTIANRKFHLIGASIDYSGFQHVDFVIEAATENLELKHKILQELEANIREDAIIATNTSSLTIDQLASALKYPERLVGMHFFNPPARMPLVEIVAGSKTSPIAVQTAFDLCLRLKKTPIVVGDCSGFLVNRVFAHGFIEILRMYEEGIPMERLDKLFLKFGLPMAPFELADEIGNDVNLKAIKSFEKAYGIRMKTPEIIEAMAAKGYYGKKNGKGFYLYGNSKRKVNPAIEKLMTIKQGADLSDDEVVDRAMLAMINESARCLEEKVVTNPGYLDMALVFGVGFPPFRGGLLKYADTIGIESLMEKFNRFEQKFGDRYAPCGRLKTMQKENRNFFDFKA